MVPTLRSTRLAWIGFGALLAAITAVLIAFSPAAEARHSMPAPTAARALITATPTPTVIRCDSTLTVDDDTPEIGQAVTFTFSNECVCANDRANACSFDVDRRSTFTDSGFDFRNGSMRDPDRDIVPGSFVGIADALGQTTISIDELGRAFDGDRDLGSTRLTASATVTVVSRLMCEQRGPLVRWTDAGAPRYWIYRTSPDQPTQTWIGRSLGATSFIDPNPVSGAQYFVHHAGISRRSCADLGGSIEPGLGLTCAADTGVLTWGDADQPRYWIYRSIDNGETYTWYGRTLGETYFIDPNPALDARYQVHHPGISRVNCAATAEPASPSEPLTCRERNGHLEWSDANQTKYWIYRSTDGGQTYTWLGRTFGATFFVDANRTPFMRYQVHHAGIARVSCN